MDTALRLGDAEVMRRFWHELEATGTPIIEPIPGDPGHVLLTFVWRAHQGTSAVSIMEGPEGHDVHGHRLERLGATELWFRTCRVSNRMRGEYAFVLEPPLVPGCESDWSLYGKEHERFARAWSIHLRQPHAVHLDPHNRAVDTVGATLPRSGPCYSYLELPAAAPEQWVVKRDEIARGSIERHDLNSDVLKQRRPLWVYTPPEYAAASPTESRLLVLFDGESYRSDIPTHRVLDNLQADGRIEPTVAVLISNLGRLRRRDLYFSEPFVTFIASELLPWLRTTHQVTHDPKRTIVGGLSLGGLTAAVVAFRHPELFGNVLSQGGAFHHWPGHPIGRAYAPDEPRGWLAQQLGESPRLPLRFSFDVGSKEAPMAAAAHRRLKEVLTERGYVLRYNEFAGGHSDLGWRGAFADALMFLCS